MKETKIFAEQMIGALRAFEQLLIKTKSRGIIIGGLAVSLIGRARFTEDIDAIIFTDEDNLADFIKAAESLNLIPRIKDIEDFAIRNRVLLFQYTPEHIKIDISLGLLPYEQEMYSRSKKIMIDDVSFRLPTPEDLIIMKAIARRPKDYEDIRGIISMNPGIDKTQIEYWVRQFAEILELPEMWDDLKKIL